MTSASIETWKGTQTRGAHSPAQPQRREGKVSAQVGATTMTKLGAGYGESGNNIIEHAIGG